MIYIIVLLLMLVAVYAFDVRRHKLFSIFSYWAFFVILVLIAGLRYRIGVDSISYENDFRDMPTVWELFKYKFSTTRYEPGYIIFSSIPRSFTDDFTLFQIVHAVVVNLVVFWFIARNSTHRFLCLTFYFIIMYLNLNTQVLRESLAVCIFLLSWPFFRDNKWLYYYPLAILACFFHTSALLLLFLPLICLPGIRSLFIVGKRSVIVCLALFIIGLIIQAKFSSLLSAVALTDKMMDRVDAYAENEYSSSGLSWVGISMFALRYCIYPMVAAYVLYGNRFRHGTKYRNERNKERKSERMEMIVVLSAYMMVIAMSVSIFMRYFNYFGLFSLAVIASWIFTKIRVNNKSYRLKLAYWCVVLVPYCFLGINDYMGPINKSGTLKVYNVYTPYSSRLDPQEDPQRERVFRYYTVR